MTDLSDVFDRPRSQAGPLLTVAGVSVAFGGVVAVDDLSFEVGGHDVVALIGPNGAGKSTTLNAISGLIRSTGSIRLDGVELGGMRPAQIAAAGIGRSFQDPPFVSGQSVIENVMTGAHLRLEYGIASQLFRRRLVRAAEARMVARADALLRLVGLRDEAATPVDALPYGARKLVDVVRAMMAGPKLLLLDEPSSGLDHHERARLQEILLALRRERRVGIVIVEHHIDLVLAVATSVVALQGGAVLAVGSASDVLGSDEVHEAFVGDASPADADAGSKEQAYG